MPWEHEAYKEFHSEYAYTQTMTSQSLQATLVSFINSIRAQEPGFVELRHDHFMKKAETVLADSLPKFRDTYRLEQNGQQYPMYRFPKREATLMAMSYSHKISAQIYDRMEALEKQADYAENWHQNAVLWYYYCMFRA